MSDLIDRQTAIDTMKDMYRAAEKWLRDSTDDVTKARAESCMATLVEIKLRIDKTMGKGTLTDDDCMEAAKSVLGEDELPAVQPDHTADIGKKVSISCGHENDLISRQAAIDACTDRFGICVKKEALEALPSAQPEPKWIPCSERLPEKAGEYLITKIRIGWNGQKYTEIAVDYFYGDYGKEYGMVWKISKKVVAWMPFPEPYRGGEE